MTPNPSLKGEPYLGFTDELEQACTVGTQPRNSELLQQWKNTLETDEEVMTYRSDLCVTYSMLISVARSDRVEIIKCLMEPGSSADVKTVDAAIQSRNVKLLDYLMLQHRWKINRPRSSCHTPALG